MIGYDVSDGAARVSVAEAQRMLRGAPVGSGTTEINTGLALPFTTVVIGAQPQTGASTVALATSEALAAAGWRVHLVDVADPDRCGLSAVTSRELGLVVDGGWRRGTRASITVDRRARAAGPIDGSSMPTLEADATPVATVLDLGHGRPGEPAQSGCRLIIVCRFTVPGLDAAERLMAQAAAPPDCLAALSPWRSRSWVQHGAGTRVRELEAAGRLVRFPTDHRVAQAGLTVDPLPRCLREAGAAVSRLVLRGRER